MAEENERRNGSGAVGKGILAGMTVTISIVGLFWLRIDDHERNGIHPNNVSREEWKAYREDLQIRLSRIEAQVEKLLEERAKK